MMRRHHTNFGPSSLDHSTFEPDWNGFGWVRRLMAAGFVLVFVMPVLLAAALTALFAGWTGAAVAAIVSISVLVAGVLLSRFMFRSLRTVNELVELTARLAEGDYGARVSGDGPPAFGPMTRSFNDMAQRLESSDDLRRRLLADVGHELRTPLTIIRGELEAMADGVREPNEAEIRQLLVDVTSMERLLDDLKTLSTTEAGVLALHTEPIDLCELVESVAARFRSESDANRVVLVVENSSEPIDVNLDPHRLSEVVLNLLTNALRAVDAGGTISIRTFVKSVENDEVAVIEVTDDGVGVAPDQMEAVFDRFHRGPGSEGSGLGLTISRGLVEAHRGTLTASSIEGQGTTMTVHLPIG